MIRNENFILTCLTISVMLKATLDDGWKVFQNMLFQILLITLAVTSASKMVPFIVGGQEVSIVNWPFMAFVEVSSTFHASCGGSLISSQTVLTAAHCLDDFTRKKTVSGVTFTIYMGHSTYAKAKMFRNVEDYVSPKDYNPDDDDIKFDIGIMFLSKPVKFSASVQKVILQKEYNAEKDKNLVVAGWGKTDPLGKFSSSKTLKAVKLVSKKICKKWYGVICTKARGNQYPFTGDSGGPLVKSNNHRQVGIVSFRDPNSGMSAFTSVPHFYDWIKKNQLRLFRKYCNVGK